MTQYTINDGQQLKELMDQLLFNPSGEQRSITRISLNRREFEIFQQFNSPDDTGQYFYRDDIQIIGV